MAALEVQIQMFLFVETLTAQATCPLRGTILLFGRLLRTEYVAQRMKWTFQWNFHLTKDENDALNAKFNSICIVSLPDISLGLEAISIEQFCVQRVHSRVNMIF